MKRIAQLWSSLESWFDGLVNKGTQDLPVVEDPEFSQIHSLYSTSTSPLASPRP